MDTIFLDRDGVINRDRPDYVKSRAEFHFIPGSRKALALLAEHGLRTILITNQSAVGRGIISEATLEDIHRYMLAEVEAAGGKIDAIFYCPHRPEDGCDCRKPRPGLIRKAAAGYSLKLDQSLMIGDSAKDIRAANAAGCSKACLVKTGNWQEALAELSTAGLAPDKLFNDLLEATCWIIARYRRGKGRPLAGGRWK